MKTRNSMASRGKAMDQALLSRFGVRVAMWQPAKRQPDGNRKEADIRPSRTIIRARMTSGRCWRLLPALTKMRREKSLTRMSPKKSVT
jgi:hypothetical protein